MANPNITPIDLSSVGIGTPDCTDEVINFGGADVLAAGTILARNTSTLKLQIYVKGGSTNGNGIPVAVLQHELTATDSGDLPIRPIRRGKVRQDKLIIDADGSGANVDNVVLDLLRSVGIIPVKASQLSTPDNT